MDSLLRGGEPLPRLREQGRDAAKDVLKGNAELYEELETAVKAKLNEPAAK
jgi:hypothetical protein